MNIQTMLLPHKHVRFSSSLIAIAGYIKQLLETPKTIDDLWVSIEASKNKSLIDPNFTQLILALNLLFAIKQIDQDKEGRLMLKNVEARFIQ